MAFLLPFSTGPKNGQVVVAYGLPLLFLAGFIGVTVLIFRNAIKQEYYSILSSLVYMFFF